MNWLRTFLGLLSIERTKGSMAERRMMSTLNFPPAPLRPRSNRSRRRFLAASWSFDSTKREDSCRSSSCDARRDASVHHQELVFYRERRRVVPGQRTLCGQRLAPPAGGWPRGSLWGWEDRNRARYAHRRRKVPRQRRGHGPVGNAWQRRKHGNRTTSRSRCSSGERNGPTNILDSGATGARGFSSIEAWPIGWPRRSVGNAEWPDELSCFDKAVTFSGWLEYKCPRIHAEVLTAIATRLERGCVGPRVYLSHEGSSAERSCSMTVGYGHLVATPRLRRVLA